MIVKLDSETSCRAAYIDYYTNENSSVTEEDMRRIVRRYDDATRKSWQRTYRATSNDENKYEFDDEQFEEIRLESYEDTKDDYGEDVNLRDSKARNVGDSAAVGLSGATGLGGTLLGSGGSGMLGKLFGGGGKLFAKTSSTTFLTKGGKAANFSKGGLIGYILSAFSCAISFAVALNAKLNPANEEEIAAVNELYSEMENQQEVINEQSEELSNLESEIEEASNNALEEKDDANEDIETRASEHQGYTNTYNVLQAKINSGKTLSASETSLYNGITSIMKTSSSDIKTRIASANENLKGNLESISGLESDLDVVATNIADVQGVTDYAAEIDEATLKACDTQSKAQKWNATNSYIAAAGMAIATVTFAGELGFINPIAWVVTALGAVLAGLAIAAGIMSNKSAAKQAEYAAQANAEVGLRIDTQDMNTALQENYDEGVDIYNQSVAGIETATVNEPNNLTQPAPTPTPAPSVNPFNNGNPDDDNDNKKKGQASYLR